MLVFTRQDGLWRIILKITKCTKRKNNIRKPYFLSYTQLKSLYIRLLSFVAKLQCSLPTNTWLLAVMVVIVVVILVVVVIFEVEGMDAEVVVHCIETNI